MEMLTQEKGVVYTFEIDAIYTRFYLLGTYEPPLHLVFFFLSFNQRSCNQHFNAVAKNQNYYVRDVGKLSKFPHSSDSSI